MLIELVVRPICLYLVAINMVKLNYGKLLSTWLSLNVFVCVFLCCPFFHGMSWMRSGT